MDIFVDSARTDSDLCDCGIECEIVEHFVLRCTRWIKQLRTLIGALGPRFNSLSHMLGGKREIVGDASDPNRGAWKSDVKIVSVVIAFAMEKTLSP